MTYRHQQYYTTRPPLKARLWTAARYALYFVAAGFLIAALAGCSERAQGATKPSDTILRIFTDTDTGCQYLGAYGETITPRIAADGSSHLGCKTQQQGKQ